MNLAELLQPLPFTQLTWMALVVLLLPFASFLVMAGYEVLGSRKGHWFAVGFLFINTVLSFYLFSQIWPYGSIHSRVDWFNIQYSNFAYQFTAGILLNPLTVLMLVVVNLISLLVHIFSIEYMKHERGYNRYFAFLGLFTFAMLGIILADNLFIIFIFWELVGLSSYLLIGFWYQKASAVAANKKAFLVNRVGDLGFLIGILILYTQFGTLDLGALEQLMPLSSIKGEAWINHLQIDGLISVHTLSAFMLTLAGVGLFCGAVGKSAQFPLQVWLPDAMEGPTPVSALIHAATMVAAGVYLLARVFIFLSPNTLTIIAFIGAITAFMGAVAAFTQHDIKKVLAYSTISQLGYMVMGMGVGAYDAALFHLLTHAFFKACLFLTAGAVIHALHKASHNNSSLYLFDAQDMRYMGGLRKKMPITFITYLVAMLALAGIPLFSGFLSKDAILAGTVGWAKVASKEVSLFAYLVPLLGFVTALMTAVYMGRQLFYVFFGSNKLEEIGGNAAEVAAHIKDGNWYIKLPVIMLAFLSIGFVFNINPFNADDSWPMEGLETPVPVLPGSAVDFTAANRLFEISEVTLRYHTAAAVLALLMSVGGVLLAYFFFHQDGKGAYYSPEYHPQGFLSNLSYRNWYLNEIYDRTFIRVGKKLIKLATWIDSYIIDPIVNFVGIFHVVISNIITWFDKMFVDGFVNFTVWVAGRFGVVSKSIQGGNIQSYVIWMFVGVLAILMWIIL